jgi:hypothetical protein
MNTFSLNTFKKFLMIIGGFVVLLSCKKGCTDPEAYNYNSNRTIDNGSCRYYKTVTLDSVKVNSFAELNNQNQGWDAGFSPDIDNNNTLPDLFLGFRSPTNYVSNNATVLYYDVNPFDVDYTFELNPKLTSSQWINSGYWIYLYDLEYDNTFELIDSVFIEPFDYYGSTRDTRFQKVISVDKGFNLMNLKAYFSWSE